MARQGVQRFELQGLTRGLQPGSTRIPLQSGCGAANGSEKNQGASLRVAVQIEVCRKGLNGFRVDFER